MRTKAGDFLNEDQSWWLFQWGPKLVTFWLFEWKLNEQILWKFFRKSRRVQNISISGYSNKFLTTEIIVMGFVKKLWSTCGQDSTSKCWKISYSKINEVREFSVGSLSFNLLVFRLPLRALWTNLGDYTLRSTVENQKNNKNLQI